MNNTIKETFTLTLSYEMTVNTETGEVLETKLINRSVNNVPSKKKPVIQDDNPEPILTLEDTKYSLNSAAIALLKVAPDDRLDIKYENGTPIIGTEEAFGTQKTGNRLTKSLTVSYRGIKREELAKHGDKFKLIAHPTKQDLFILDSGKELVRPAGDTNVNIDEEDFLDLEGLIDAQDANITEIDSNFFKL